MTEERSRRSLLDTGWDVLQIWGVPIGMTGAYMLMMWSSDTDTTGKAWMSIGLGFVLVVWFVFRMLTLNAALARAIDVGDAARILAICERYLGKHRGNAARAPYLVARAIGHEVLGEWALSLRSLDEAELAVLPAKKRALWQLRASSTRVAALLGSGQIPAAREVLERELAPDAKHAPHSDAYLVANLAAGRVLAAEGKAAEAEARLRRVSDDIRASAAMRAAVAGSLPPSA